jgi:hypothetical protein
MQEIRHTVKPEGSNRNEESGTDRQWCKRCPFQQPMGNANANGNGVELGHTERRRAHERRANPIKNQTYENMTGENI